MELNTKHSLNDKKVNFLKKTYCDRREKGKSTPHVLFSVGAVDVGGQDVVTGRESGAPQLQASSAPTTKCCSLH